MPRMTKKTFQTLQDLAACVGQEVAVSDWIAITQEQVNQFAEATGDHQWIHVDIERAKAGPFGGPIAHGFLTLSLLPRFFETALEVVESRMGVNYGLNRVRFMSPVPVGKRLREFVAGLGVPVLGELRDTQNYVQLAARGLTLFDIAPGRVQKDLEQWEPIRQWLEA